MQDFDPNLRDEPPADPPADPTRPALADPPWNEEERLAALQRYAVLDTPAESGFDDLVQVLARVCDAPIGLVSLVQTRRQWFKAETGLGLSETPIEQSMCVQAMRHADVTVVPDTRLDPRFRDNTLVTGDDPMLFYAGAPLLTEEGLPLGMLCVLDRQARPQGLSADQIFVMKALASQVMAQLELRRSVARRKQVEAALRKSEQDHRQILESALDYAIITMDLTGHVTTWSAGAVTILGWTPDEMKGRPAHLFFTAEDRAAGIPEKEMGSALLHGRGSDERWHLRHDGSRFWASGEMMPLIAADGTVEGFLKILRDRTEERLARIALREQEMHLAAIFDQAVAGIAELDLDGRFVDLNERFAAMAGCAAPKSLAGRAMADIVQPDHADAVRQGIARLVETGEPFQMEMQVAAPAAASRATPSDASSPNGSALAAPTEAASAWMYVSLSLVRTDSGLEPSEQAIATSRRSRGWPAAASAGSQTSVVAVAIDISAQKRSEAALIRLNETLEQRVAAALDDRSRAQTRLQRTEDALRQAQKMEAIGQLTGGIAHDFNNLLAGITGSLEMLQRRVAAGRVSEAQKYIDAAGRSASRAAALTHRLLAFARRQALDVKPVDLSEVVHSMEELLRRTLGVTVVLSVASDPDLWLAIADANQFENALLNLVLNARDAMPSGGKLTVETRNTRLDASYVAEYEGLAAGDYVVLAVSDTGRGMTASEMSKAFEPFFTTKPIGQGTGLGLSMIYGFAQQSGGHVRIYSEEGRGTVVKLFLPRSTTDLSAQALDEPTRDTPRARDGETVLVVEDDPALRMLVVEVLEDLGYGALQAEEGTAALAIARDDRRLDLLITDVGLPGMNGRQLAEVIRLKRPALKVLFITGYAEGAAVRGGFLDDGMEMITKPFALDALAERIRNMIGGDS
jgi:PAS domain S-box-containing protein